MEVWVVMYHGGDVRVGGLGGKGGGAKVDSA